MGMNTKTIQPPVQTANDQPDVPPGYKRTEVGLIPEDWEVLRFCDHFNIYAGGDVPKDSLSQTRTEKSRYPIYANAIQNKGLYGFTSYKRAKPDSVTITARGYLGHAEYRDEPFFPIVRLLVLEPIGSLDARYTTYAINNRVKFSIESTGVPQLTAPQVGKYAIAVPPTIKEQRAIAEALSDVDGLLAALEKLIARKRAIKQGAMQQLLTGKTRLPGFTKDWKATLLDRCGSTYGGITGKGKADFGHGTARYVTFLNVLENAIIQPSMFEAVDIGPDETQNRVRRGDVLFNGTSETPEDVALSACVLDDWDDLYLNSFCFGFRFHPDMDHDPLFFAYFFRGPTGRQLMSALAQGATRYNLSKRQFLQLKCSLPDGEEQRAIAAVLSDMDAEIAALERRRDKTKQIKQGMMQQLLTGRVRLVKNGEGTP